MRTRLRPAGVPMSQWVFGYGSLVWRPAFPYAERTPAHIYGFKRRFWQCSPDHRGTPLAPGRVVTLVREPSEQTWGMAYRIAPGHEAAVLAALDHREKAGYAHHRVPLHTSDGRTIEDGLVYVATPTNPNFVGPSHPDDLARLVLSRTGPSGDNATYVLQLARALRAMGADDAHTHGLAARIEALIGPRKQELRKRTWQALRDAGAARFPGTAGRIPNFKGAEAAADQLAATEVWKSARRLKCNPDSPHRPVRHRALKGGKIVVMAAPKLAVEQPFWILDPEALPSGSLWEASSIVGAERLGRPAGPADVGHIDLICTGCVAVTAAGARLGKGGGYSDLEYAVLVELGLVHTDTPIWTTVHPVQVLPDGAVPMLPHDISLDGFCTPDEVVTCSRPFPRPTGVDPELLPAEKRAAIPVLSQR